MNDVLTFISQARKERNALVILENMENFAQAHLQQIQFSYKSQGILVELSAGGEAYCSVSKTYTDSTERILQGLLKSPGIFGVGLIAAQMYKPKISQLPYRTTLIKVTYLPKALRVLSCYCDGDLNGSIMIPVELVKSIAISS